MVVSIQGKRMYLWCAVDSEGEVLDVLLQAKRDTKAARKLMRKLLKRQGMAPREWVTDKNPAYGAALRELKLTGGPTYPAQAGQQPSRKLAPAREATRTEAARVQDAEVSPAVPVPARGHLQRLHRSSPPCLCPHSPPLPSGGVRGLAECGQHRRLIRAGARLVAATCHNVTRPFRGLFTVLLSRLSLLHRCYQRPRRSSR
jgi:DDE superfamily endonuclease